ncbi:hypothetical protein BZA77DRAFT_323087 [Pyronema omphalodes]|nr:hypothetical protein BZA77DRAFT_323087 [Pyronema omphalodes]
MDSHTPFLSNLSQHNIQIHASLQPSNIPNSGIGILATSSIPSNTQIAHVPRRSLINPTTLPARPPGSPKLSPHTQLALTLLSPPERLKTWVATVPTDFSSHPLCWRDEEISLLPKSTGRLLNELQTRYHKDRDSVSGVDEEKFKWAWLVVNTRTLYHPAGGMTMCPFIDYFNHADSGCRVELTGRGYTVTTQRDIEKGEEVFVTYGHHSSDFLLVEYGFCPEENGHDYVICDGWMEFGEKEEEVIRGKGYWGKWIRDREGWCYRSQVAGGVGGPGYLDGVLGKIREEAKEKIAAAEKLQEGYPKEMLLRRWKQILQLC